MDLILVAVALAFVIWLYFKTNPLNHSKKFMMRRFINWFPMGMTYAFLYMARYNLSVSKNALGEMMTKEDFGLIFGAGTVVYGLSFLLNGPLVDKIGGKKGIIIASLGSCMANVVMGVVTYLYVQGLLKSNMVLIYSVLYAVNMFFQSYGAVSIIKVKAYWFHVRERGVFGAIFGTLISFGIYFAFDWGQAIADASVLKPKLPLSPFQQLFRAAFAIDTGTHDAIWLLFFIPSFILVFWALIDMWLLKDAPSDANFEDFDTHDASSDEMDMDFTIGQLLKKIFTNPILLTVAMIEFTSGVIRNGVVQWYFIFAHDIPQIGAEFFNKHWGLLICLTGIFGGFLAGWMSDSLFQSRRGPPAALMVGTSFVFTVVLAIILKASPVGVGICVVTVSLATIGVHAIMSGTAAADFGGRKATATASGITDGFVYLGTGLQSVCLGYLTTKDWSYWPLFLIPFTVIGLLLAIKIWHAIPAATKKYFLSLQNASLVVVNTESVEFEVSDSEVLR
jgi:OPA family glycerol-3-phosphate transporter-like MFS transporter